MLREEHRSAAVTARIQPARTGGPHWRALLEARWQARLQEVTELSLAYHSAAAAGPDGHGQEETQRLLRRAVAARRKLANVVVGGAVAASLWHDRSRPRPGNEQKGTVHR